MTLFLSAQFICEDGLIRLLSSCVTRRWTDVYKGALAIPRTPEWTRPHQVWKVRSCFQQHSLFSKDLLVSESLQNAGIHWFSCKTAWAKACCKGIRDFLCAIFYFLRWHKTLCQLDPAFFFRLSHVLCSQDTDFTISMSSTAYLQTAFLFPSGHMKTLRNGPFICVLQTNRMVRCNQVEHSPVCPLLSFHLSQFPTSDLWRPSC